MKDQEYDYFYDDEQDAQYCYPGTNVLKNKFNIRDLTTLHEAERDYSSVRQAELANMGVTLRIYVLFIGSYLKIFIYGQERQEQSTSPRARFFV